MEFRDVLKMLRQKLGLTQMDLAAALHVTAMTVSRWERGVVYPNRAMVSLLLGYAYTHAVEPDCVNALRTSLKNLPKRKEGSNDERGKIAAEYTSLAGFIEVPVYVSDVSTHKILYVNLKAFDMLDGEERNLQGRKCYEALMNCGAPCDFCHPDRLSKNDFSEGEKTASDGEGVIFGKLVRWNGHDAQIRCIIGSKAEKE